MLREDKPLFFARFPVISHVVKKNNRPIHRAGRGGQSFLGKGPKLVKAENEMHKAFTYRKMEQAITKPFNCELHACFHFTFNDYWTKKNERRKTLPDLSNLIQLPEDMLQETGIIENDSLIMSLDGSRRLAGPTNYIEVWLWEYKG